MCTRISVSSRLPQQEADRDVVINFIRWKQRKKKSWSFCRREAYLLFFGIMVQSTLETLTHIAYPHWVRATRRRKSSKQPRQQSTKKSIFEFHPTLLNLVGLSNVGYHMAGTPDQKLPSQFKDFFGLVCRRSVGRAKIHFNEYSRARLWESCAARWESQISLLTQQSVESSNSRS